MFQLDFETSFSLSGWKCELITFSFELLKQEDKLIKVCYVMTQLLKEKSVSMLKGTNSLVYRSVNDDDACCYFQNCVNRSMKLSIWDEQVVNNYLNNNINYRDEIEEMFNNNTNNNLKIEGDFNNSQLEMFHVDQHLNFSSFWSFLAGKYVTD